MFLNVSEEFLQKTIIYAYLITLKYLFEGKRKIKEIKLIKI
jgi:hypothetical protein